MISKHTLMITFFKKPQLGFYLFTFLHTGKWFRLINWIQFLVNTQLNVKTVLFQIIQFSISTAFCQHTVWIQFLVNTQLNVKTLLFQIIQFSISTAFC